jgi:hypothetical protein
MTALLYSLDYHHWIMVGLFCLVLDAVTRSSAPMWLGLAALVEGFGVLLAPLGGIHPGWQTQLVSFAMILPFSLLGWWWLDLRLPRHLPAHLVGRRVRLEQPLHDGRGELRIDGRHWPVRGPDLPAGTEVEISARGPLAFRVQAVENTRP